MVHGRLFSHPRLFKPILTRSGGTGVDKCRYLDELRKNDDALRKIVRKGRYLLYGGRELRPLISSDTNNPRWLNHGDVEGLLSRPPAKAPLLAIADDGAPLFAVSPAIEGVEIAEDRFEGALFSDLRLCMFTSDEASLLTRGWSVLKWHRGTRFCSYCGSGDLERNLAGSRLTCSGCSRTHYPGISPVGIVLISDSANSRVLLVSLFRHPKSMFSCVAGYLDAGETIEDCVVREIAEEVGLRADAVEYAGASQYWPFPAGSLMLGFEARVAEGTLSLCPDEVREALWLTPGEVGRALRGESGEFHIPPTGTVARRLIVHWMTKYHQNHL